MKLIKQNVLSGLTLCVLLLAWQVQAGLGEMSMEKAKQAVANDWQEIESKLKLSDKQKDSVKSILDKAKQDKQNILQQAGVDRQKLQGPKALTNAKRRKLANDLKGVDKQTKDSMAKVLDKDQMKQWSSLQKARQKMQKVKKMNMAGF